MRHIAVELKAVSYKYHGHKTAALENVNLKIEVGSFVLISGSSGSGKTTLSRCINGLVPHFYEGNFSGEVILGGEDTKNFALRDFGKKVGSVFQDPRSQFFMTDTTNEIAFGCVNQKLEREEIWKRTELAARKLNIEKLKDKSIFKLSSGQMQKVTIASVYAMQPDIYVFDEPSANLDFASIIELGKILGELKREGKTVIVLEHRVFYLSGLLDRLIYLEDGKIKNDYSREKALSLSEQELTELGLRSFNLEKVGIPEKTSSKINSENQLKITGLAFAYKKSSRIIKNLSLEASGGQVIALTGKNGEGKTTFARVCCGLLKQASGSIELNGKKISQRKRSGKFYFVMQDSDYQLFGDSVLNELKFCHKKNDYQENQKILEDLSLWEKRDCHPASLSRGQKQRLTIASAIKTGSEVMFFDEPTSGLDRKNMQCVAGITRSLAAENRIIFVITHDYEFILNACNRVLYLNDGEIQKDFMLCENNKKEVLELLEKGEAYHE
ncbi:MAG: energy-coupling factor ABC transporter ATP-binding protein [Treponema sp.]|nr:energy-coupling factor ABC transporter ATP-binding protein [Treponema sp.]